MRTSGEALWVGKQQVQRPGMGLNHVPGQRACRGQCLRVFRSITGSAGLPDGE